jgi:bacillopeptidase F
MKYLTILLCLVTIATAGIIHPQLAERIATLKNNESLEIIVHMEAQANLNSLPKGTTKAEKILYLKEFTRQHQADLLHYLETRQVIVDQTWWIFNGLMFTATKDVIEEVAVREDIDYVIDNFELHIHLVGKAPGSIKLETRTPEWNITMVSAPQCWNDGFDGTGIIVGNIDTGVDANHPAFGSRWVSGGWHDPINNQPNPYDDHGHGTHTMGTICGGDGNGSFTDDIGVAPGANFMMAKG